MTRTTIYEIIALQYCVYRNSTELLSKMNEFQFNTNYIFLFVCECLKRILDELRQKLETYYKLKKRNRKKEFITNNNFMTSRQLRRMSVF